MRWQGQELHHEADAPLPGLTRLDSLVRSVTTPEFAGVTFHEVLARSALNHVPGSSRAMPYSWTINPYRGCQHACVYCFARPTHHYLDFDTGVDFETQIVVKINIVEVLKAELRRRGSQIPAINLGTNTDPYQRAEGRYQLMPGIIDAIGRHGRPFSILTKGTLLRRDLGRLSDIASDLPVGLAMSVAIFDDELQRAIEPAVPTAHARLNTVRAAVEQGLSCSVLMMPILPYLTDTRAHLDHALAMIKESGAHRVLYSPLHLRPGVRDWFMGWLSHHHPALVNRYQELYGDRAYVPRSYSRWLAARMKPLLRSHGLDQPAQPHFRHREPEPTTQSIASLGERASSALAQPTLFDSAAED